MPLLHVFQDLARRYPNLLITDLSRPGEGPFTVEDVRAGIESQYKEAEVTEALNPGILEYLTSPAFLWDIDEAGYVNVLERDPRTGRFTRIFEQPRIDMPVVQVR